MKITKPEVMMMESYFALLLFVAPGFITQVLYEIVKHDESESNQFVLATSALIWSIVILSINYFVVTNFWQGRYDTIADLHKQFLLVPFLIDYAKLTVMVSLAMALIWDIIGKKLFLIPVNWYRKIRGRNRKLDSKALLNEKFNDGKSHLIQIEKGDDIIAFGTLANISANSDFKELYITNIDDLKKIKDIGLASKTKGVYYDFNSGTKIVEYVDDIAPQKNE